MKELWLEIGVAILLLVLGGIAGYAVRDHYATRAIAQERSDKKTAVSNAEAQAKALGALQGRFDDLQKNHAAMRDAATAALDQRDQRIASLLRQARARANTITETVNHDPSCADLARLPVCSAVADRLWGGADGTGAAPGR